MNLFKGYTNGYADGMLDARGLYEKQIERLELALVRAYEDAQDARLQLKEANERADLACDRLMAVYGREGISAAYTREKSRDIQSRVDFTKAVNYDPLAPVSFGDPECRYKTPEEAQGDYA